MLKLLFYRTGKKGFKEIKNFIPTTIKTLNCIFDAIGKLPYLPCFFKQKYNDTRNKGQHKKNWNPEIPC